MWRTQPAAGVFTVKHSDCSATVHLTLLPKPERWAVRLLREEVLAEWSACGTALNVHCTMLAADGGCLLPSALRLTAFRREVAGVLAAVAAEEADHIRRFPHLRWANVYLHYHDDRSAAYVHGVGTLATASGELLSGRG